MYMLSQFCSAVRLEAYTLKDGLLYDSVFRLYFGLYIQFQTRHLDDFQGYYIVKEYPPETVTRAFHLVYQVKKPNVSFSQFVSTWGYRILN